MPAFVFHLEPVLRQRQRAEDQLQRELAQFLRQQLIFQNQLRAMQQDISDDKRRMAASLVGVVDVSRIRQHAAHSGQVTMRAHQIVLRLAALESQVEQSRERLNRAVRARKAIELLRDRQHRRWKQEQDRREAAQLDELAVQRFARRAGVVAR